MPKMRNLSNQRFGRLLVIEPTEQRSAGGFVCWRCLCDCGAETAANSRSLISGDKRSCGCLQKEVARQNKTTHGSHGTRLYNIWSSMKDRCALTTCKAYPNYGGRGITVCAEWSDSFETFRDWAFSNGYAEYLSIDRTDNDKGYEPGNCRWATPTEQANNRRPRKRKYLDEEER